MLPPIGMKSRPRPLLAPGILMCALLVAVSASMPADKCPGSLDCAREKRHFCPPGSTHCGPCLTPLEENEEGQCVVRKRHAPSGKMTSRPELDEEIDFLSAVIAKQQDTGAKQSVTPTQVSPKANPEGPVQKKPPNATAGLPKTSAAPTPLPPLPPTEHSGRGHHPLVAPYPSRDRMLITLVGVCVIVGMVALILSAVCWIRLQKDTRLAEKVDYPAFCGAPPASSSDRTSPGDKKLAQSAQMYHYQHQKQQMLSMEKHKEEAKVSDSGATSDEENEDGDFTVYECPGLAPTGEMEVKNPLFDDSTLQPQRNHK
ncbi:neural proliferation differentiation and control protein 1a isoform X1 [Anguilla anguilla]|uniref:neural proliferation differentiation and control protein 1a isoform X1 n=1 Tax=Anguilla anguilla TaxID=7936 RepID=UPI0015A9A38D|nr:neural proliferation differentiation and control protein 1a isoform X1 [Anguilla anguilla]